MGSSKLFGISVLLLATACGSSTSDAPDAGGGAGVDARVGVDGAPATDGAPLADDAAPGADGTAAEDAAPLEPDGGPGRDATALSDGGPGRDAAALPDTDGGPPQCGPATLLPPCADDAVSALPADGYGTPGTFTVQVESFANPRPGVRSDVTVYRPQGQTGVPVLFFAHAFGATDPAVYDPLLRLLASNGYAVVHVPYPTLPGGDCQNAERYAALWAGFRAAVARLPAVLDTTRVGFVGHSFGGGATPEMARRGFVEEGWGSAGRLMFVMAPWYSWGSGYETIPADTKLVVQVYADDDANEHQIAADDVWARVPSTLERAWLMIRTDSCGACGVNAAHSYPMQAPGPSMNPQNVANGGDRWGVYRRIHALARYALEGEAAARDVAFGVDAAMGTWTACGRDVRPLEASATGPITAMCRAPMYLMSARAAAADVGTECP